MPLKGIDLANPPDLVRLAVPRSRESRVVTLAFVRPRGRRSSSQTRGWGVGTSDLDLVEPRLGRLPEREGTRVELNEGDRKHDAR